MASLHYIAAFLLLIAFFFLIVAVPVAPIAMFLIERLGLHKHSDVKAEDPNSDLPQDSDVSLEAKNIQFDRSMSIIGNGVLVAIIIASILPLPATIWTLKKLDYDPPWGTPWTSSDFDASLQNAQRDYAAQLAKMDQELQAARDRTSNEDSTLKKQIQVTQDALNKLRAITDEERKAIHSSAPNDWATLGLAFVAGLLPAIAYTLAYDHVVDWFPFLLPASKRPRK